jgi:hypothetical protein
VLGLAFVVGGVLLGGLWTACQSPGMMAAQTGPASAGATRGPDATRAAGTGDQDLSKQSQADADRKSAGCITCHTTTDSPSMHTSTTVKLGCADCHGGQVEVRLPAGVVAGTPRYNEVKNEAHVLPRFPRIWKDAANPPQTYTLLSRESTEFIQFFNPGDLRVANRTCGANGCHPAEVAQVRKSMMTTAPMLWNAALYNNGSYPIKLPRFSESFDGQPTRVFTLPQPTAEETSKKGILAYLDPFPRFEISQPGNILRVFERGQRKPLEIGVPTVEEDPGKPANRLSARGLGTLNRTDPTFLNIQKTRLYDPMLSFLGTNDHPGDYRSSGCSACHVMYANDRSPVHSGPFAQYGHLGRSATADPTIPKNESGHPIKHTFTNAIPSSQCGVCHNHPGTTLTISYLGYTWWDHETDGAQMYPKAERKLTARQIDEIQRANPEAAALRGLWSDPTFLANVTDLNPTLTRTQFADFHGRGWIFRSVYKQDRKGNLLDDKGALVSADDPDRLKKAVHLKDIHIERGMHCTDCHFKQDVHGNGKLYGETRNAIEINCVDCHGTIQSRATLRTSGPAAPAGGTDLGLMQTPFGQRRFFRRGDKLFQRSSVTKDLEWEVVQILDTIDPASDWALAHPEQSQRSRLAKTLRKDGTTWGDVPDKMPDLAHADSRMTCYTCHSSWVTSCFGCHLPMKANERKPLLHNEGDTLRNWTSYNPQVLRDDVFMLGVDGTVTGNRIAPVRSSSAVLVGSQNANREWVYSQQQTVSSEGYSGQAFNTHVPHTVRATETKMCTDCHVSAKNDNNAILAQLLLQGTNFVNFMGRYVYVAEGKSGLQAVVVTEQNEPQAVIGSHLHQLAYPAAFQAHQERGQALRQAAHHRGRDVLDVFGGDEVLGIQLRGEFLYTANGPGGFRAYDVAQVDQKGFSEKIVTAPVSPLGQRLYVKTKYATAVASPTTLAVDPTRSRRPENQEQPIHPLYAYLYVTDKYEGLVVIGNPAGDRNRPGVATLLDGDPNNNFLQRAVTFNPGGVLDGAVNLTIAGTYAYIAADRGLIIVSLDDPLKPKVVAEIGAPAIVKPRAVAVQFRYAFVTDENGLKVVDVTTPERPRAIPEAVVPLADARGIYLARTYAYVAAGAQGLVIVDIELPERPALDQVYTANGAISDARDVKVGMTNASLFAYVADGKNGLRVLQLTSPKTTPTNFGFSPRPGPVLIATYRTHGPALAISKGLDRDRAVDESGNQVAVFGRLGARPFTLAEMRRLYLRGGQLYTVTDEPPGSPVLRKEPAKEEAEPEPPGQRPRRVPRTE